MVREENLAAAKAALASPKKQVKAGAAQVEVGALSSTPALDKLALHS
jgi:hypothetical protein